MWVELYFNFVGRFVPPAFGEVELTQEELEEIRKREERKDRLHQNYLKRKASGAQKQYEDKIKERKKAEMDAKKAAIRAEDLLGFIHYNPEIMDADRQGKSPYDFSPTAIEEIRKIKEILDRDDC